MSRCGFLAALLLAGGVLVADAQAGGVASAPRDVVAVAGSASHMDLSWAAGSPDAAEFLIERRAEGGDWEPAGRVPASRTRFQSVGLLARRSYEHRVCAASRDGRSDWAVSGAVRTPAPFPGPRGTVIVASSKEFPRNGEGSFVLLRGGELAYYYGAWPTTGDDARGTCIARIASRDNGDTWSPPAIVLKDPAYDLYHPCLARLADGALGLAYTKRKSGTKLAEKVFRRSEDDGAAWGAEAAISDGGWTRYITGAHDRLVRLASGRLVVPVFLAQLNSPVVVGGKPAAASLVFASDDQGRTWRRKTPSPLAIQEPAGEPHCEEPGIVELAPGKLLMFLRTLRGGVYESRSLDNGDTWSDPVPSTVRGPRAPARLERVPGTDAVILAWNPQVSGEDWHRGARLVLALQTTRDGGATWDGYQQLEYDGQTWFDYPSLFCAGDVLHVAYRAVRQRGKAWQGVDVRYLRLPIPSLVAPAPRPERP